MINASSSATSMTNDSATIRAQAHDSSSSSAAIYVEERNIEDVHTSHPSSKQQEESSANNGGVNVSVGGTGTTNVTVNSNTTSDSYRTHRSSLYGHDYVRKFAIQKQKQLQMQSQMQAHLQMQMQLSTAHMAHKSKKHKYRDSDCPSDVDSMDSRRRKHNKSRRRNQMRAMVAWLRSMNTVICDAIKLCFDMMSVWYSKLQKWQKEFHEAPMEVKEKYFFVVSTIISTVLFYLLFVCLDVMIKHWFALPWLISEYSFSISYCIAYLTSVVWQHFFNQYFVFTMTRHTHAADTSADTFCDSLLRTYLVYGCSLLSTGLIGSLLQVYCGIPDEFVLFVTLPISGVMNYYLLRHCHRQQHNQLPQHRYQALPTTTHTHRNKHRNMHRGHSKQTRKTKGMQMYAPLPSTVVKHNKKPAIDDIVIV